MSQETVNKAKSNSPSGTLASLSTNLTTKIKPFEPNLDDLNRTAKTSRSMPLLHEPEHNHKEKKSLSSFTLYQNSEINESVTHFNRSSSHMSEVSNQQSEIEKAKTSAIKKIFLYIIVPGITLGVSIGEAAPVYYFISTDKNLQKLDAKWLATLAILATVAAFILSLALFYQAMVDTVNNSDKIWKIVRHGEVRNKDNETEKYARGQRVIIIFAFLLSICSAVAVGALAYNSITKALPKIAPGMPGVTIIGAIVFGFEILATTAVNNFYFVNTLRAIFKKDKDNSFKGTLKVIGNWFPETSKRVAGLEPDSKQKLWDLPWKKKIKVGAFWLILAGLYLFTGYILFQLFYIHLMGLSFLSMPSSIALAITSAAMTVNYVFRFKSIYELILFAFDKKTRQKNLPQMRSANQKGFSAKTVGFFLVNVLVIMGCTLAPALNGLGQGLGAFDIKDSLPNGFLSSNTVIIIGAIGIFLASCSANGFAFIQTFAKRSAQQNESDENPLDQSKRPYKPTLTDLIITECCKVEEP